MLNILVSNYILRRCAIPWLLPALLLPPNEPPPKTFLLAFSALGLPPKPLKRPPLDDANRPPPPPALVVVDCALVVLLPPNTLPPVFICWLPNTGGALDKEMNNMPDLDFKQCC